jgi:hypothetical protein
MTGHDYVITYFVKTIKEHCNYSTPIRSKMQKKPGQKLSYTKHTNT